MPCCRVGRLAWKPDCPDPIPPRLVVVPPDAYATNFFPQGTCSGILGVTQLSASEEMSGHDRRC
jgi:hypothetical protein